MTDPREGPFGVMMHALMAAESSMQWSGGAWAHDDGESSLVIPHPFFRERAFVLGPAATIAGRWRDPLSGLTVRHLLARLTKPPPAPR